MEAVLGVVKGKSPIEFRLPSFRKIPILPEPMLTFHPADIHDFGSLRSLAERIWHHSYAGIISHEQIVYMLDWMYSEETIAREMAEGLHWELVRFDGLDAGYLSVTFGPDGVAKLNKLYLLPELQGRGHAQAMLSHIFTLAAKRHSREVRLQVNKGNVRAQRAYERFGFRQIENAVFDIGGGYVMDDFIMSRAVDP